jgi:tetratricopeptide (TPR) repeat protein
MVPGKIDKLCLKARQAIAAREWDKAKQAYLMALGLKSDMPDVHYGLATVYFQLQEFTSAVHHFREVTRLDPLRAGAYVNLGAVHNLMGNFDEAVVALRKGIQLDPQRVEGYYNLGLVYRKKSQIDLAIQAYREALRLNPRMADAHLNLANLYLEKSQAKAALQHYDQALEIRPGWEKAVDGRAHAEAMLSPQSSETMPEPVGSAATGKHGSTIDLNRIADPNAHGGLLNSLHTSSTETETNGKQLQQLLAAEIEPVIKELSTCLLYPDAPLSELATCVQRFEAALERMRSLQASLKESATKMRQAAAEHFPAG